MRWVPLFPVLFLLLAFPCAAPLLAQLPSTRESPARAQIEQLVEQSHSNVAVAFRSLDGSQDLFLDADEPFPTSPAAMQIPVLMELYQEAQTGAVNLNETVLVHNGFPSLIDGKSYDLAPQTDPDPGLYDSIGKAVTLRQLAEDMEAHNSTLAAALLIEKLGADNIRRRIAELHATGIDFVRGAQPTTPASKKENLVTARSMLELLWNLAKGQAAGNPSSEEMIGMIARAALSQPPNAGMPSDPRALESVELAGVGQQAMIVYGPHPFVVVVLVRGVNNRQTMAQLMAQIEHALAAALT
jgi:Beta-lactamase enzyme family